MADNVTLPGTGEIVAADDIGGVMYQKVKLAAGVDGTAADVSAAAPLPVAAYGELVEAIEALRMTVGQLASGIGRAMPDTAGRLRTVVDGNLSTVSTVSTVSAVTAVANVTNLQLAGGWSVAPQTPALMGFAVDALRRNITVT